MSHIVTSHMSAHKTINYNNTKKEFYLGLVFSSLFKDYTKIEIIFVFLTVFFIKARLKFVFLVTLLLYSISYAVKETNLH